MATRDQVLQAISTIHDPDLGRDVVSVGMVKDLEIRGGSVSFTFELTTAACPVKARIPFLGALPLDDVIREGADAGRPAAAVAGSSQAEAFRGLARQLAAQISVGAFRRLPIIQVR